MKSVRSKSIVQSYFIFQHTPPCCHTFETMFTALSKVLGFFLNEEDEMPENEDTIFQPDTGDFIF